MRFDSWLKGLGARLPNRPKKLRLSAHGRRSKIILCVEQLEERSLLSASIPMGTTNWALIGPAPVNNGQVPGSLAVSGRITGIAADPGNANIIYVAAAGGGVWKTTNAGGSWTPLTDNQSTLF